MPILSSTMVAQTVAFWIIAVAMALAAIAVVRSQNVVHAALFLVVVLAGAAAQYILVAAEFVAWVQVLIYIGAVVVLMLFGAMLTRAPVGRVQELDSGNRPVAGLAAVATAGVLGTLVVTAFKGAYVDIHHTGIGDGRALGGAVFRYFVLPFEVASVLLLAALVGAIVLTRREI
jgi:NADH-quinone oxidoreductase subunit J